MEEDVQTHESIKIYLCKTIFRSVVNAHFAQKQALKTQLFINIQHCQDTIFYLQCVYFFK